MKWFKHDSNAHSDAKLKRLKHKYGIVGYGIYWYCVELIAEGIEKSSISFELEEDAGLIALEWNLEQLKVQEIMEYMIELELFENDSGRITCLKLAKRLDDTNAKNPEIRNIINKINSKKVVQHNETKCTPNISEHVGETPKVSDQIRLDQIRLDKDQTLCAFEIFWNAGLVKQGKKNSLKKFAVICKKLKIPPDKLANQLKYDIRTRIQHGQMGIDKLHPSTYLNGERWRDEQSASSSKHDNQFDTPGGRAIEAARKLCG